LERLAFKVAAAFSLLRHEVAGNRWKKEKKSVPFFDCHKLKIFRRT
jgi:hypothetical protein